MGKKNELIGQLSIFEMDIYHHEEDIEGQEIQTPPEPKEQEKPQLVVDTTKEEQTEPTLQKQQVRQTEPLEEGEVIWSRYGDESGQLKSYVVTSTTPKGYIVADCNAPEYKIPVTLRSEGIAWSRIKEIAGKL